MIVLVRTLYMYVQNVNFNRVSQNRSSRIFFAKITASTLIDIDWLLYSNTKPHSLSWPMDDLNFRHVGMRVDGVGHRGHGHRGTGTGGRSPPKGFVLHMCVYVCYVV